MIVRVIAQRVPLSVATGPVPPLEPGADVQPAGLELGAVRGGGDLAVAVLGRQPAVAVVLAGRAQAQVAAGQLQHLVRDLERVDELLLPAAAAAGARRRRPRARSRRTSRPCRTSARGRCRGCPCRTSRPRAGSSGCSRRSAAAARRRRGSRRSGTRPAAPRRCPPGRGRPPRGGRRPARPGRGTRCPPSPDGFTSAGGIIAVKPLLQRRAHGQVQQGELELGALTGEEVEAGAGDLRPALDVDRAEQLAELEVVARREALGGEVARLPVRLEHDVVVLAALGHPVGDEVADLLEQPGRTRSPSSPDNASAFLTRSASSLVRLSSAVRSSPVARGIWRAEVLLLGPQRLVPGDRTAARLVGRQQVVDERHRLARARPGRRGRGQGRCAAPGRRSPVQPIEQTRPDPGVVRPRAAQAAGPASCQETPKRSWTQANGPNP